MIPKTSIAWFDLVYLLKNYNYLTLYHWVLNAYYHITLKVDLMRLRKFVHRSAMYFDHRIGMQTEPGDIL